MRLAIVKAFLLGLSSVKRMEVGGGLEDTGDVSLLVGVAV